MKLPAFEYARPTTLAEAATLLAASGGAGKIIAGGQSLMPILAFRLASPTILVDLRNIPDMARIQITADEVVVGAKVRWRDIEVDPNVRTKHPLLAAAIPHIAHYQIRNRGTVGGSLAHADPAAELPGLAVACDGELTVFSSRGHRKIQASKFFLGPLSTALEPDEIVVSLGLPAWKVGRRWGFDEVARRRGDFAVAGVAMFHDLDGSGRAVNVHIGVFGAADRPHRLAAAEAALTGQVVSESVIERVVAAAKAEVDPPEDIHASAAYRRALTGALIERTLKRMSKMSSE
jgi:carbon-monoxide dehydrogenase medium subunit